MTSYRRCRDFISPWGAEQYPDGLLVLFDKTKYIQQDRFGLLPGCVRLTQSGAIQAQTEAAVQEQIEKLVAENSEAYLEKDETLAGKLTRAAAAREEPAALKEQLDQVNNFVTWLKDYTNGAARASDGAAALSTGAVLVSAGASTLQETGSHALKESILTAEKSAAEKLLPLVEKDLASALNVWNTTKDHLADTGYDLRPENMAAETVYIIRTDLITLKPVSPFSGSIPVFAARKVRFTAGMQETGCPPPYV